MNTDQRPGGRWPLSLLVPICAICAICGVLSSARADEIIMREALVIGPVGSSGRSVVHTDSIELMFVDGTWRMPREGDMVELPTGMKGDEGLEGASGRSVKTWRMAAADEHDWLACPEMRGGYAAWAVQSAERRVMILEASGHGMVYINAEPRVGDPYEMGYVRLPVLLKAGQNEFVFKGGRGRIRAKLVEPAAPVMIDVADITQGDVLAGQEMEWLGAAVVINATEQAIGGAGSGWKTRVSGDAASAEAELPIIQPMTIRKVPFRLEKRWDADLRREDKEVDAAEAELKLEVLGPGTDGEAVAAAGRIKARVLRGAPGQMRKIAFVSRIDGSVQYYAVRTATGETGPDGKGLPGLVLTLHGAGVEATNQANAYQPKSWCHIVAPTNRRPFGFDWEDWGREDAMEVLEDAMKRFPTDPRRVYLTGHSMGGHGTWQIGLTYPEKFAAIAPSAGWATFWTYSAGGKPPWEGCEAGSVEEIIGQSSRGSDTLALTANSLGMGVYILHGDADDNVPVGQARLMKSELEKIHHPDMQYHEEPGAGHWWGDRCVDWPGIFEMFERRQLAESAAAEPVRVLRPETMFKSAFDRGFVLMVEPSGDPEIEAWGRAKARYDAETWWYRGNGSVDVSHSGQAGEAFRLGDRNVIAYASPRFVAKLLESKGIPGSPIAGDGSGGVACLIKLVALPGKDAAFAVAVVGGTDLAGMRLTDRVPFFTSGVGIPGVMVFDTGMLRDGMNGVRATGWLGPDGSVEKGEFAQRQPAGGTAKP